MVDLSAQFAAARQYMTPSPQQLLESGQYIGGPVIKDFEQAWAEYCGVAHAIGTSSGTSALTACFAALLSRWRSAKAKSEGKRIRIITQANTFVATANAALRIPDLEVVFVDCDEYFGMSVIDLQRALDDRPEDWDVTIVVPVHMYGIMCDMQAISTLVNQRTGVFLVEDASHAHGSRDIYGRMAGAYSDLAAFSLFPAKPLGAAGDAGIVTTNQHYYEKHIRSYCNVGRGHDWETYDRVGFTYRLDALQALILRAKLHCLDDWREYRERVATKYWAELQANFIQLPVTRPVTFSCAWYGFPLRIVRDIRERLQTRLFEQGIPCKRYYPQILPSGPPLAREKIAGRVHVVGDLHVARKCCDEVLCIPIHEFLSDEQQDFIIKQINDCTSSWTGV